MTNKTGRSNINPILLADFNVNNYKQAVFNKFGYYPPSVQGMSINNIPIQPKIWKYTEKTDGYNCFIIVNNVVYQCEYYKGVYYVFDAIVKGNLDQRLLYIQKALKDNKYIHIKKFYDVQSFSIKELNNLLNKKWTENTDGIIFSQIKQEYQNQSHLKLKPKHLITNDYLYRYIKGQYYLQVVGDKKAYYQSNAYTYKYVLSKSHKKQSIFDFFLPYVINGRYSYIIDKDSLQHITDKTIKKMFQKGSLDGLIVETAYTDEMIPYPIRIRTDKEFPNNFYTCLSNYENRLTPIDSPQTEQYFNTQLHEQSKYKEFTEYGNEYRKKLLEESLPKSDTKLTVFDFGSGRGVNYHILFNYNILSLEPDRFAQIEQYSRMRTIQQQRKSHMPLYLIFNYDSLDFILQNYPKYNMFISNYSIHYMLNNQQNVQLVLSLMKRAKIVDLLFYSGQKIIDLCKEQKEHKGEYKTELYHIICSHETLKDYGQKFQILLPTIQKELQTEYLVNFNYIKQQLHPKQTKQIKIDTKDEYLNLIEAQIMYLK